MDRKHLPIHALVLLAVVGVVAALTTLPAGVPIISFFKHLTVINGHPNANDALGHAGLYGTVTAAAYWALRGRIGFTRAFWIALVVALCMGLTTELLQHFSPGRDAQLSDLLGDWLGAMTVIALIGYGHSMAKERLQKAV
jgi:VanZ family protein